MLQGAERVQRCRGAEVQRFRGAAVQGCRGAEKCRLEIRHLSDAALSHDKHLR